MVMPSSVPTILLPDNSVIYLVSSATEILSKCKETVAPSIRAAFEIDRRKWVSPFFSSWEFTSATASSGYTPVQSIGPTVTIESFVNTRSSGNGIHTTTARVTPTVSVTAAIAATVIVNLRVLAIGLS